MKRWTCPDCGRGALGVERPKKNASVRYCFPCSEKTGLLVERRCFALEKKREAKRDRAAARAERQRDRERAREKERWTFGAYDLRMEAQVLCKHLDIPAPELVLRERKNGEHVSGHSQGGKVVLTIPAGAKPASALMLLCHELAHEARPRGEHHTDGWRSVYVNLVGCFYNAIVWYGQHDTVHALDVAVEKKIQEAFDKEEREAGKEAGETRLENEGKVESFVDPATDRKHWRLVA